MLRFLALAVRMDLFLLRWEDGMGVCVSVEIESQV